MGIHLLHWVLIFFCLGASIGLYLISRVFRRLPRQNGIMMVHGLFAAVGMGSLFYYSAFEPSFDIPYASIFFFVLAIFGGVLMVMWDKIMNRKLPRGIPIAHAASAITGIVLLVLFMFQHHVFG